MPVVAVRAYRLLLEVQIRAAEEVLQGFSSTQNLLVLAGFDAKKFYICLNLLKSVVFKALTINFHQS
jgi:hypothetical protein